MFGVHADIARSLSHSDAVLTEYNNMWCAELATRPPLISDCRRTHCSLIYVGECAG